MANDFIGPLVVILQKKKKEQEQAFQYTVSRFIAVCSISAGVIGLSQEELRRTGKVPNEPKL